MAISTAIDPSQVSRAVGILTEFRDTRGVSARFLPQRIAVIAQGATASTFATTKAQVFTSDAVGTTYGTGSPLHLAVRKLLPQSGGGVGNIPVTVYPVDDAGAGVAAVGDITPSFGTIVPASYKVRASNIDSLPFTVVTGETVGTAVAKMITACNAVPAFPLIASDGTTKLTLTAKWKGTTGNDVEVEVIGVTTGGATWAITQPTGGLNDPTIDAALAQIGNVWETLIINGCAAADTAALGSLQVLGEARWGALIRKPFLAFVGTTEATAATAYAISDARKTDRINCLAVNPGSKDLPVVVAADLVRVVALVAQSNPARDYCAQPLTGLVQGLDSEQWTGTVREAAMQAGCSTVEVVDGVVRVSDTVTMYHPTGEAYPKYRYVCDQIKLWQVLYNLGLKFDGPDWSGAPLIPDDQPTTNASAKKPKMAKAAAAGIVDALALEAVLSDPATSKANILAGISEVNPKRLDLMIPVTIAGNTNIISADLYFSFYYGQAPIVG